MAKAKRSRDYRVEEARRNEVARSLGFSSRAQMRRVQRHGLALPRKGNSPRGPLAVPAKPRKPVSPGLLRRYSARPPAPTVTPITGKSLTPIRRIRRESQAWSNAHSRVDTSRYDPDFPAKQARLYHAAFVDPDTRAWKIENGLDSLRDYLVDEMGFYNDVEFDERYGIDIAV